jgi:hypothetical protein
VGHGHGHYLFFSLQLLSCCSQLGSAFHYSAVVAMAHTGVWRFFDFADNHGSTPPYWERKNQRTTGPGYLDKMRITELLAVPVFSNTSNNYLLENERAHAITK